jgi:hypothetical protein
MQTPEVAVVILLGRAVVAILMGYFFYLLAVRLVPGASAVWARIARAVAVKDLPAAMIFGGLGIGVLGFIFSESRWEGQYARRIDDLRLSVLGTAFPYRWILGFAVCAVLVGFYLVFAGRRHHG